MVLFYKLIKIYFKTDRELVYRFKNKTDVSKFQKNTPLSKHEPNKFFF